MRDWAALAGKPAAVLSVTGLGVAPAIGSATVDSFAIGAVAAGACVAVVSQGWRGTARPLRPGRLSRVRGLGRASRNQPAAPGRTTAMSEARVSARDRLGSMLSHLHRDDPHSGPARDADLPDEGFWGPDNRRVGNGYRSRHRLTDPSQAPRRPDNRRTIPRHAAPSLSQRLAGKRSAA